MNFVHCMSVRNEIPFTAHHAALASVSRQCAIAILYSRTGPRESLCGIPVDRILQLRLNNLEKQILVGISGPRGYQSYGN